jgi:hypothetical protein
MIWRWWKKVSTESLIKLKIPKQKAWEWANTRKGLPHIQHFHSTRRYSQLYSS